MNIRTGDLFTLGEVKKKPIAEQKHFVEIPDAFLPEIEGMNRQERRKWLKLNRKRIERFTASEK